MSVPAAEPVFAHPSLEETLQPGRPTWALVDLDAVTANLDALRRRLPEDCGVLAVVKADAYGLGADQVAGALRDAGVDWFGVAAVEEGRALRRAGIEGRILLLGGIFPSQAAAAVAHELTPTVYTPEAVRALAEAARGRGRPFAVHLKVDTGMGRLGVPLEQLPAFLESCPELAAGNPESPLHVEGLFTHLARADEASPEAEAWSRTQERRFARALELLGKQGHENLLTHVSNSAAALHRPLASPAEGGRLVRPGLALYGADPRGNARCEPVLHWCTRILFLKDLPAGEPVGYGSTWKAPNPRRVATLPVGYHDGYDRRLSNRGLVRIDGRRCPVVGRVSMDLVTVDVTEAGRPDPGDLAWLLEGPAPSEGEPAVTLGEMAEQIGCLPYEILCGISRRVPRLYLREGRVVAVHGAP